MVGFLQWVSVSLTPARMPVCCTMRKPVAILQHEASQGPGVLLHHLQQQGLEYRLIVPWADDSAPRHARDYSGLIVLGSNHGVNDASPWIAREQRLLEDALAHDVPVLGHCFGAQLLARAMGARVTRNPCPHIGWGRVWATPAGRQQLQLPASLEIFNWHYDSFEIPRGAARTMYGRHCLNKGFVHGRHWAFQGHLEVTPASVRDWCQESGAELVLARGPEVQSQAAILAELPRRSSALRALALQIYAGWTRQLEAPVSICTWGGAKASLPRAAVRREARVRIV